MLVRAILNLALSSLSFSAISTAFLGYFVEQNGTWFKSVIKAEPYFYIGFDPK